MEFWRSSLTQLVFNKRLALANMSVECDAISGLIVPIVLIKNKVFFKLNLSFY